MKVGGSALSDALLVLTQIRLHDLKETGSPPERSLMPLRSPSGISDLPLSIAELCAENV